MTEPKQEIIPEVKPYMRHYRCDECGNISREDEILTAPNPFLEIDTLNGCPHCASIDELVLVCDEPGCRNEATSGTPVVGGYRQTCYQHTPEMVR